MIREEWVDLLMQILRVCPKRVFKIVPTINSITQRAVILYYACSHG